ncbi:hypothetical protein AN958_08656 [Leucoagaricus sp. SymC.cos]|nr:hypothetical protein AN958_08656 [Leucoagaricus sp. SymC.cos]
MPRLAYLAIAFIPAALSQTISQAICSVSSLSWTFNTLGDSPCQVAANLAGVCDGGVFTLTPLEPGFVYLGPSKITQNSCRCSSVYYSMLSACAACQDSNWLDWNQYDGNCTTVYTGSFPQPIPTGTRVPGWAYADILVMLSSLLFSHPSNSLTLDRPETTGVASATNTFPSSTLTRTPTAGSPSLTSLPGNGSSSSSGSGSHAGAIAGGVIGGVVGLALIAGLAFFFIRRRQGARGPVTSAFNTTPYTPAPYNPEPVPEMSYNPSPSTSYAPQVQPQILYDPSDPSTFPTTPAPMPSSPYTTTYTPPPASTTYTSLQSSTAQIAQPHMPTPAPAPTGHYTGAPEL